MPKYGYLVVEGSHDVEFVCRLLLPFKLKRVQKFDELDPYFAGLVPRSFPPDNDLLKRVPVPLFLQSPTHTIAIHSAIGDSRLVRTIEENANQIKFGDLTGIGIILDSDQEIPAIVRYNSIKKEMSDSGYELPKNPGTVSGESPKIGAFVLPDNQSPGNLEDILISCAQNAFPNLLASAQVHVENARNDTSFVDVKREDLSKRPTFNKAVVGAIATTLRPGRGVAPSIQDNIWLKDDSLRLPIVKAVQDFVADLFELNVQSS